jgi:exodeoxyribonuclease VII large subunit
MTFHNDALPFDERPPAPAPSAGPAAGVRQVSLTRLYAELGRAFAATGRLQIEGDVHDVRVTRQGSVWFTLRDRAYDLPVLISATKARKSRIVDGERVAVTGRVTLQQRKVQMLLDADEVTPVGEGAVAALLAEVRARLTKAGYVDRPRRPIPRLPIGIGVVCGTDAAVRRDIEAVVAAKFPGFPVRFYETSVQGSGAADAVRRAIDELVLDASIDVIVLARGGGSAVDLLPFSDEDLCLAVARCTKPVVSAIGHDGDRPVCDDVADVRCGTPSIAAQTVIPDLRALREQLDRARQDVARSAVRRFVAATNQMDSVRWDSALDRRFARCQETLTNVSWTSALDRRLQRDHDALRAVRWDAVLPARWSESSQQLSRIDPSAPLRRRVDGAYANLAVLHGRVEALSPARVLERGYAVVRNRLGEVIRSAELTTSGDQLDITLASGQLHVEVRS